MKTFALILFATAVQAINLYDNGMSSWAHDREDDWNTGDAEKYGGARAYAPAWSSLGNSSSGLGSSNRGGNNGRRNNGGKGGLGSDEGEDSGDDSPPNANEMAVENANENSAVAGGKDEVTLGDDGEADDGEESADDEGKGNNRNNDNRMNIDEWKPALRSYLDARRDARGEDEEGDGLKSGAGAKRPLAADYKMGAQEW